jgi:hypothetical protein
MRAAPNFGTMYFSMSRRYVACVLGDSRRHSDKNSAAHSAIGMLAAFGSTHDPRVRSTSISLMNRSASARRSNVFDVR